MLLRQTAAAFLLAFALFAQPAETTAKASTVPTTLAVPDATPIRLRLTHDLAYGNIKVDEHVDLEVMDDLRIDGVLVLSRGAKAAGTITQVEPRSRFGKGGKMGVTLDWILLLSGAKLPVRAAQPVAPHVLFAFAREDSFPEGTAITVYSAGEMNLDPARFLVDMHFTSNPPGALVTMYGAPVGRTPFITRLAPGSYQAVFSAQGYTDLTQSIAVGPGNSNTVDAAFESRR